MCATNMKYLNYKGLRIVATNMKCLYYKGLRMITS